MSKKNDNFSFFKRINTLLFLIFCLFIFTMLFYPKFSKLVEMKKQEQNVDKRIAEMKNDIKYLNENRKALIKDKDYIEKVARDKMGWSGSNELIYQFDDEEQQN
ncbi:MAG: septum formation initiator family protein [Candidatus Aureabacteria bacterium]|nr:septum formation initiator family protein [Candidatus Auribacterota bacterium]